MFRICCRHVEISTHANDQSNGCMHIHITCIERTHLAKDAVLQAGGEDVDAVLLGVLREPGLAGLVRSGLNSAEES